MLCNKLRRILPVAIIFVVAFLLIGVFKCIHNKNEQFSSSETIQTDDLETETRTEIHKITYRLEDFDYLRIARNGERMKGFGFAARSLEEINAHWPVTYYRLSEKERLYVVYSIMDKYENVERLYVFFSPIEEAQIAPGEDAMENKEEWRISGERVFFVNKQLCYADFSGITKGSTFAEVAAVDPAAWIQEPYEGPDREITTKECRTCHYLTDGILFISYSRDTLAEPFTVASVKYQDSHELGGYDMYIHPDDLP